MKPCEIRVWNLYLGGLKLQVRAYKPMLTVTITAKMACMGSPPETRRCGHCGIPLKKAQRSTARYCGDRCRQAAHRGTEYTGRNRVNGRKPKPDHPVRDPHLATCLGCGQEIVGGRRNRLWCSVDCEQRQRREVGGRRRTAADIVDRFDEQSAALGQKFHMPEWPRRYGSG